MKTLLVVLISVLTLAAADWPAFRGPNSTGVAEEKNLPLVFGPTEKVVFKTPLPPGHSSPILVGDAIFLTAFEGEKLLVMALDRKTGAVRWRREVPRPRKQELHKSNSPASPSPVSDGKNVYAFFTDFGLISYGPDGNERWRLPLGPFNNPFGMGASPLLVGDRLIQNCDSESGSFLIAVDTKTGKQLWRVERPEVGRGFSTPVLYQPPNGKVQALITGSYRMSAIDVETGKPVWWYDKLTWQMKPTPVIDLEKQRVFVLGWAGGSDEGNQADVGTFEEALTKFDANKDGRIAKDELSDSKLLVADWRSLDLDNDGTMGARDWQMYAKRRMAVNALWAFKLGGSGDMTEKGVLWRHTKSLPNAPSPLYYRGIVYLMKEGGILTALDADTGQVKKQARLQGALDPYYASPVASDGKVYVVSQTGRLVVVKAGADWEVLQMNEMDDEVYATPALVDGRIYVRTRSALYAFGN